MPEDDDFVTALRSGKPLHRARVEDVDTCKFRTLDERKWNELVSCRWIRLRQNALILGPAGIGKTFVAAALCHRSSQNGYSVFYTSGMRLLQNLIGTAKPLNRREHSALLSQKGLLAIDDFPPAVLLGDSDAETIATFLGDRRLHSSLLLISNMPLSHWSRYWSAATRHLLDPVIVGAHILELKAQGCRGH